ncbi:class I SAM-dependent methyltransferase [Egicoccus sp. AB-alg6-2]|uniref:class I SAM-dependent methyltransferase n=1 Tax=Egicoccus sp. AB-alg6-2 TaxID=3242692 RepID=UPI00359E7EAD
MSGVHETATGFDGVAAEYESARPGYEASIVGRMVDLLGLRAGRRVADVGAGTGKLTRSLLTTGAEVVAVEPMAGMREQLRRSIPAPELDIVAGTAEDLPFPDGSLHAVTAAQAFHWFAGPEALAEFHRVLRPDGHLGVIFNRRDLSTPVQGALDELLLPHRGDTPSWARHEWVEWLTESPHFAAPVTDSAPWVQHLDAEGLVARIASVSFVARLDDRTRARVLAAVRDLYDGSRKDPDGRVPLHYTTELWVLARRDADS